MFRFTIRELVLLTLVVAMGVGWWVRPMRVRLRTLLIVLTVGPMFSAWFYLQLQEFRARYQESRARRAKEKALAESEAFGRWYQSLLDSGWQRRYYYPPLDSQPESAPPDAYQL